MTAAVTEALSDKTTARMEDKCILLVCFGFVLTNTACPRSRGSTMATNALKYDGGRGARSYAYSLSVEQISLATWKSYSNSLTTRVLAARILEISMRGQVRHSHATNGCEAMRAVSQSA